MTMIRHLPHFIVGAVLTTACASQPSPAAKPQSDWQASDAAGVRALLLARHPEALPTKETLDHHLCAACSLRHLATTDSTILVRARALKLLDFYPDAMSEQLWLAVINDSNQNSKLRAAAIHALRSLPLADRADLREVLRGALASADVQVAVAAVEVAGGVAQLKSSVRELGENASVAPEVRRAAERASVTTSD